MDHKEIRLALQVSTEHLDSCNACFARNYDPIISPPLGERVDKLYKLKVGMMTVTLCPKCLLRLRGLINEVEGQP